MERYFVEAIFSKKLGVISLSLQSECNAVYYCKISSSQKMLKLPLVASLENHAMALKIHDFGELRRCKRWRQRAGSQSPTQSKFSIFKILVTLIFMMPFSTVKYLSPKKCYSYHWLLASKSMRWHSRFSISVNLSIYRQ